MSDDKVMCEFCGKRMGIRGSWKHKAAHAKSFCAFFGIPKEEWSSIVYVRKDELKEYVTRNYSKERRRKMGVI